MSKPAAIKYLWIIVECPHCFAPQVFHKLVRNNQIWSPVEQIPRSCEMCSEEYTIQLELNNEDFWNGEKGE